MSNTKLSHLNKKSRISRTMHDGISTGTRQVLEGWNAEVIKSNTLAIIHGENMNILKRNTKSLDAIMK